MRALVCINPHLASEFIQLAFELDDSIEARVHLVGLQCMGRVGCCLEASGERLHEAGMDSTKGEDDAEDNLLFV